MIATIGKAALSRRAAKNWLSTRGQRQPWLLIIDNADDGPVEDYFPDGSSGTILITTRNPMLQIHGTAGPGSYHFNEMERTESVELLLKAASAPRPLSQSTFTSAGIVCKKVGYLPLVLVHAGTTITARLCTMENYLDYFERNWTRIRRMKRLKDGSTITDVNAAIFASYELIHDTLLAKRTQASKDALDLLKIFSFLHQQRIRVDFFIRAAVNPNLEKVDHERRLQMDKQLVFQSRNKLTWSQTCRQTAINVCFFFQQLGSRTILPNLIHHDGGMASFDDIGLRQALRELFQVSLIFPNSDSNNDSYSMHPAVHLWVRERAEMTLSEQAIWCQMTANILSQAILLPPLGDTEEDEIIRRDLLPHVSQVQNNERLIQVKFLENREERKKRIWNLWPILQPRFDRYRALQLVKFSLVYAQGDQLKEAEKLQTKVANFARENLGIEHTSTMDIMLLLSSTYWRLVKGEEAADLQKQVLMACIRVRGKDDLKTLKVMDAYGSSRWLQGRVLEARQIHTEAVEGLQKALGKNHVDTLRAMGNLGRAIGKDFEFTKAIGIHLEVYTGLRTQLGDSHLDTLIAMDNLAMAYYDRAAFGYGHPGDLDKAITMELEVFATRKEKLGREHFYTLWAGLNLARIKAAKGEAEEALAIFLEGHEIALRNLGETHFGVLIGKTHWARILICAERYGEAEIILSEVVNTYEGRRKIHPDRLLAVFSLIKCRNLLGRKDETVALLDELTECTKVLFGPDHPSVKYLLDPQNLSAEPVITSSPQIDLVEVGHTRSYAVEKPLDATMISRYGHI